MSIVSRSAGLDGGGHDESDAGTDSGGGTREYNVRGGGSDGDNLEAAADIAEKVAEKNQNLMAAMKRLTADMEYKASYEKTEKAFGKIGKAIGIASDAVDVLDVLADTWDGMSQGKSQEEAFRDAIDRKVISERETNPYLDRMFTEGLGAPPLPPRF